MGSWVGMKFGVLGSLAVTDGENRAIELAAPRQRAVPMVCAERVVCLSMVTTGDLDTTNSFLAAGILGKDVNRPRGAQRQLLRTLAICAFLRRLPLP